MRVKDLEKEEEKKKKKKEEETNLKSLLGLF